MNDYSSMMAGVGIAFWVFSLAIYVYFSYCQVKLAERLGHSDSAWWSWVPIMSLFLWIKMADKPMWWFALCLIPIVNIAVMIMLCVAVAKNLGKSALWGILMIVPVVNFASIGMMAFSDDSGSQYERVPAGSASGSSHGSGAGSHSGSHSHNRDHA